jgi:hypothetical protein
MPCSPFGAKARSQQTQTSAIPLTRPRFGQIQHRGAYHPPQCQGMQANGRIQRRRFRRTRHEKTNEPTSPRARPRPRPSPSPIIDFARVLFWPKAEFCPRRACLARVTPALPRSRHPPSRLPCPGHACLAQVTPCPGRVTPRRACLARVTRALPRSRRALAASPQVRSPPYICLICTPNVCIRMVPFSLQT